VVGFANRFRPTYPGFPVEVGGVELGHAAFFERKPHTRSWLVLRSRKSGQRWCERRAPVWICGSVIGLRGDLRYPTSREKRARYGAPGGCGGTRAKKLVPSIFHLLPATEFAQKRDLGHPLNNSSASARFVRELADVFAPVFQVLLHLGHKPACICAIDDAVIEAQGKTNDVADRNGVGTALIGNYRRLFK
jgi:hypothetical protein